MGVERFYMTGGEPFLRPDLDALVRRITEDAGRELILLTNATLLRGPGGAPIEGWSRERVKFQVSVDGARPETNDPIRGAGTFEKALDGLRVLAGKGFDVSLTTVVARQNLRELAELTRLGGRGGRPLPAPDVGAPQGPRALQRQRLLPRSSPTSSSR